jgi:hypothetical protein
MQLIIYLFFYKFNEKYTNEEAYLINFDYIMKFFFLHFFTRNLKDI